MTDPRQKPYGIHDLVQLMRRLRDPESGCPWDLQQDFASIVPSTLEEVYEVVDAIERDDRNNLREELGDLLFQVVFYAQLASESGDFDFESVVDGIVSKLLRRHPHVFPNGTLQDCAASAPTLGDRELLEQWERIKQEEKRIALGTRVGGVLDGVPRALPALQRAYKLQKKLAGVGFDWNSIDAVLPVVEGELEELRQALREGSADTVAEELGDLLFSVVNACRHCQVDPETVLRDTNRKIERRFAAVEQQLKQQGKDVSTATLDEMEALWQMAKSSVSSR